MRDPIRRLGILASLSVVSACTAGSTSAPAPRATPDAMTASEGRASTTTEASGGAAMAAAVDVGTSTDSWFSIDFHGRRVGHVRARSTPAKLGDAPAVHVERWSLITVRRREEVIRMEHQLHAWFAPDGTPLRYTILRREGGEERRGEGTKEGTRFVVRHTVGGRAKTRSFALKEGDRLASSLEWLYLTEPEAGVTVKGRAIDETEGDIQTFELQIGAPKTTPQGRVFAVKEIVGGIESALEVGAEKGVLRSELLGAGIVMERTSQVEALRLDEAVDIFSAALFPVKADLPDRDRLATVTTVFSTERGVAPTVRAYPRQAVRPLDGGRVEVVVSAPEAPTAGGRLPLEGKQIEPFLMGTDYEDLGDERLIEVARREIDGATDAWTAARRLNAFVHEHIDNKTLAHAFASATEALAERAGDCTEHAVLMSALAKIVGVPTKLITGLVYVRGPQPAFGYHEWVEVWLGDRWHPMDPTFGQEIADATHIKFSEGLSDPDGLRDAGLAAAALIGDVELEVAGWTLEGEAARP